jgi:DNA polymerase III subunit epsilon
MAGTTAWPAAGPAVQRSFDDLGTPLSDVTFVVLDLETTGTSPRDDGITEIGAIKLRGGECLGTFQTLVNPGMPVPPMITVLTGITEAMVLPAPRIAEALPAFLEFVGDAVVVGHNVGFDIGFLHAASERLGYGGFCPVRVDTLTLARRLVLDEVRDLKLETLARHCRTTHRPSHRALADALATADVLHWMLERVGTMGVTALDDLLALPTIKGTAAIGKLALTRGLPRAPGVYLFRDARGGVLYVGKASDLRTRVRSYFSTESRRKVPRLLRELHRIDHVVTAGPLEAEVLELRLIRRHEPSYNRQGRPRPVSFLRLTVEERFPRLAVVRALRPTDAAWLGPFRSSAAAQLVREAVETALPLRRCTRRIPTRWSSADAALAPPCTAAQLGVAACPCAGGCDDEGYAGIVDDLVAGFTWSPQRLLEPLVRRMLGLADAQRFEEAAATRARAEALAAALRRKRAVATLRSSGVVRLRSAHDVVEAVDGVVRCTQPEGLLGALGLEATPAPGPVVDATAPPPVFLVDELLLLHRWLEREAAGGRLRVDEVSGCLASPLPAIPVLRPRSRPSRRRA